MADRHVKVLLHPDGKVVVEAVGYAGPACLQATKAIEDALGKVTKRTTKAELLQATTKTGSKLQAGSGG